MITVLASLLFLLFLTALVSWLVLYVQFYHSVEKRWATQVLHLLHDAERRVHSENRQLRELRMERDAKTRSLREEAFAAHLCDYSVDELDAYPGIGPGTIGKLRAAGFINLAALHRERIHIHGLGEKRLADIHRAICNLLNKARSTFDAGSCRQAQELANQLKTLSADYDRLEVPVRMRARAAEEFIGRLGKAVEYARAVTFWRWCRSISKGALIPAEIMDTPLPDLKAALRAAEQPIARSKTAKRPQMQAAEPEMPGKTHLVLMELTIQFALGVARADGAVTWTARELILQHVRKRFSYNRALLNRAEAFCAHYDTAPIDWERCLNEINRRFTVAHRTALMEFASQIAVVSGQEASRAASFLLDLAQRLGVPSVTLPQRERPIPSLVPPNSPPGPAPAVKSSVAPRPAAVRVVAAASPVAVQPSSIVPAAPPKPPLLPSPPPARPVTPSPKPAIPTRNECLSLLEIPPGTPLTADLVRRQWNLLSERLTPEKLASMGPEFVKLAQTKLAALRWAAESLLKAMGEKLETKPPTPPVQNLRHNPDLDDVFGRM
jgi:tellurite resistance protein